MPATHLNPGQLELAQALAHVEHAAPVEWRRNAERAVVRLARQGRPFTTDQVWALVGAPPEPRALGVVMRWALKEGWVSKTKDFQPSARPECHCRPVKVWAAGPAALEARVAA